jgi:hypothetical protein
MGTTNSNIFADNSRAAAFALISFLPPAQSLEEVIKAETSKAFAPSFTKSQTASVGKRQTNFISRRVTRNVIGIEKKRYSSSWKCGIHGNRGALFHTNQR